MFEKEIEFIYNYYLNKIEKLSSFVTFEQLASVNLHPALLQYVSAEIDYLIYEDRQKLLKESLFDYSGEKINKYFNQIGEEVKLTKKFSRDYITKLLLHATSFNVNYTIRPNWSLMQFIFENESEKYVTEVKQILNYLYYYPYYKRILNNYFSKKHLYKITEIEFAGLLNKIDKINLNNNFTGLVDESLDNIVNFINSGEVKNNTISKRVVELFLEDKGINDPDRTLDKRFPGDLEDKYKVDDFKNAILSLKDEETAKEELDVENNRFEEVEESSTDMIGETVVNQSDHPSNYINETEKEEVSTKVEVESENNELADIQLEDVAQEFEPPEVDEITPFESRNLQEASDMVTEEDSNATELGDNDIDDRIVIEENDSVEIDLEELDKDELESIEKESETEMDENIIESSNQEDDNLNEFENDFSLNDTDSVEQNEVELNNEKEQLIEELFEEQIESSKPSESELVNEEIQDDNEEETENIGKNIEEHTPFRRDIDISELLKNRKISKVIEYVFDYDMEEFTKTIEKISECGTKEEAFQIIDLIVQDSYLDESSREIKIFKKIISELF